MLKPSNNLSSLCSESLLCQVLQKVAVKLARSEENSLKFNFSTTADLTGYKLDRMAKDRMSQGSVKVDCSLARLQTLCVNAVGPLTSLVEQGEERKIDNPKPKQ